MFHHMLHESDLGRLASLHVLQAGLDYIKKILRPKKVPIKPDAILEYLEGNQSIKITSWRSSVKLNLLSGYADSDWGNSSYQQSVIYTFSPSKRALLAWRGPLGTLTFRISQICRISQDKSG
jgi:hypothetical protein